MCGEEATLSRRRLSRENLLSTLSIPKSGGIGLQVEVSNSFPPKTGENQPHAIVVRFRGGVWAANGFSTAFLRRKASE